MGNRVDHMGSFPFCILPAVDAGVSVGADTDYPVGMTLADAMRCFWIARRWAAEGSVSVFVATIPGAELIATSSPELLDYTGWGSKGDDFNDPGLWDSVVPADERELVCGTSANAWRDQYFDDPFAGPAEVELSPGRLLYGNVRIFAAEEESGTPAIVRSGGLYYPSLFIQTGWKYDVGADTAQGFIQSRSGVGVTSAETITLDLGPGGGSYAVPAFANSVVVGVPSVTIKPRDHWQYADSGGSPVWDATTGAELTDPFG